MQNAEIARLLTDVADLLEISAGNPFKVRAYRNAARTVADHPDPVAELVSGGEFDLTELPGIGGGIAKEITALVETGLPSVMVDHEAVGVMAADVRRKLNQGA